MRRLGETNYSHLLGGFACWSIYLGLVKKTLTEISKVSNLDYQNSLWAGATGTTLTSESDNLTWLRTETQHPSLQGISFKDRGCRGRLVPKDVYWLNLRDAGVGVRDKEGKDKLPCICDHPLACHGCPWYRFSLHTFKLPCGPLPTQSWALLSGSQ